jgi:murein L,D-transpeptidase YafK
MRGISFVPVLLALSCRPAHPFGSEAVCVTDERLVVVETRTHTLWLCDERSAVGRFRVALGRGGLGKSRAGDRRTPLGSYSLGTPRASARFGTFIPIGYPAPEQSARGLTGRDVGIHGPDRRVAWLGSLNAWTDWTAGCVATGTDADVAVIAAFVRDHGPRVILE